MTKKLVLSMFFLIAPLLSNNCYAQKEPDLANSTSATESIVSSNTANPITNIKTNKQHDQGGPAELTNVSSISEEGETIGSEESYLSSFSKPWEFGDQEELVEFNFENAELSTIISYIEKKYQVKFIVADDIKPLPEGAKSIVGTKVTFRTNQPLSKKDTWNTFVAFLDMAGVTPVPGPEERTYILKGTALVNQTSPATKSPLPVFIGTELNLLPDNDMRIRYVYFVENTSLDVVKNVIDGLKSSTAPVLIQFPELRAILITDKASNVRSVITIIRELDKVNMPERLAVVKLTHADAKTVEKLYEDLAKEETQAQTLGERLRSYRKQPTMTYFSETTRVKAEPRTNSLILLGTNENVNKVISFIKKEIDKDPELTPSPLYIYPLKYADAETVAGILKDVTKFNANQDAALYGGVRDGDKYFKSTITITPEKSGNRLIINANQDDYQKIKELLNKIDVEQPQVAIKVLILSIDLTDAKELGIQLRNKVPGPFPVNVNAQTSGLAGINSTIVQNTGGTGATRLLGDLISLVNGNEPGSTLMTLGSDAFGVWGLLKVLQTYSKVSVEANPFFIATHKYQSVVSIGIARRVLAATVQNTATANSIETLNANLEVRVTPQISLSDKVTTLDVLVTLNSFTDPNDPTSGNRAEKIIQTAVIVGDNETLALGGLIQDTIQEHENKVPILGDIPILGWVFKNKTKRVVRSNLIILITPEIIPPETHQEADRFTSTKFSEMRSVRDYLDRTAEKRDPIHRWFFKDKQDSPPQGFEEQIINELVEVNKANDPHRETEYEKREVKELFQPHTLLTSSTRKPKACKKTRRLTELMQKQEEGEAA